MDVFRYCNNVVVGDCSYVSETDNHSEVSLLSFDQLPLELFPTIFAMAKSHLPSLALVNRQWRKIADSKELYEKIFPASAFGKKDWNCYFPEIDPGNEPFLPRCAYGDFEEGDLLTFIPKTLKMVDKYGNIIEKPLTLSLMGKLVKNPKSIYKTYYSYDSWKKAIIDPRTSESSHWALIKGKSIGKNMFFDDQVVFVEQQGKGASVSGLIDTVVSIFNRFIKSGEDCILTPENKNQPEHFFYVRVKDKIDGMKVVCGSGPAGLCVNPSSGFSFDYVSVAVARKSIGT